VCRARCYGLGWVSLLLGSNEFFIDKSQHCFRPSAFSGNRVAVVPTFLENSGSLSVRKKEYSRYVLFFLPTLNSGQPRPSKSPDPNTETAVGRV
jgi:hypothetical protein